jgi:hypothetical protein
MNLSTTLSLLLLSTVTQVQCFTPINLSSPKSLSTTTTTTSLNALTAADILKRARKSAGVEEEPEPEPIFNDGIMTDLQQALLLLERRVKEGPGSLSADEVRSLDGNLDRILKEMREKDSGVAPVSRAMPPPGTAAPVPAPPAPVAAPAPVATPAVPVQELDPTDIANVLNNNNEDGEEYNGEGGMGLAKGTVNTWNIEGMDEMSPEEYRDALQQSVSDRQSRRREDGITGNLSSNNYLDNL